MKRIILTGVGLALAIATQAGAETYLARCKMGECIYYDQTSRSFLRKGSGAVPGDLVEVNLRLAVSDREDSKPVDLDWQTQDPVQFFCSKKRPAFRTIEGGYQSLDLSQTFGATEMIQTMYLHACHPGVALSHSLAATFHTLGYGKTSMGDFADFGALTR